MAATILNSTSPPGIGSLPIMITIPSASSSSSSSSLSSRQQHQQRVLYSPSSASDAASDYSPFAQNPAVIEFVPFDMEEGEIDGAKFTLAFPPASSLPNAPVSAVSSGTFAASSSFLATPSACSTVSSVASLSPPTADLISPFSRIMGAMSPLPQSISNPSVPWNNRLLLFAHGHRPVGTGLIADLGPTQEFYQHLLAEGWMVGMTSYRREGIVVEDAVLDMVNLRAHVERKYGALQMCIIEGRSMGGAIATLCCENYPHLFQGAVACGAALIWKRETHLPGKRLDLSHVPLSPIIFLTNISELSPIESYIAKCREAIPIHNKKVHGPPPPKAGSILPASSPENKASETSTAASVSVASTPGALPSPDDAVDLLAWEGILPAIWSVSRDGHNWVNQTEREEAFRGLMSWLRFETFITCRRSDNTHHRQDPPHSLVTWIPRPLPGVVAGDKGKSTPDVLGGETKVTSVSVHGSFTIAATPRDLQRIGVRLGGDFYLTVSSGTSNGSHADGKTTFIDHSSAISEGAASATADSRLTPNGDGFTPTELTEPLSPVMEMVAKLPRAPSHTPGTAATTVTPPPSTRNGLTLKVRFDVYPYVRTPPDHWTACEEPENNYMVIWIRSWDYRNAAGRAGVSVGSRVFFHPLPSGPRSTSNKTVQTPALVPGYVSAPPAPIVTVAFLP